MGWFADAVHGHLRDALALSLPGRDDAPPDGWQDAVERATDCITDRV